MFVSCSGCASAPEKAATDKPLSGQGASANAELLETVKKALPEPKTAINPDVLFMLLTAELAGQRGQYGIALEGYLEAAKRAKDVRLSERAAVIAWYVKDYKKMDEAVTLWLSADPNNSTARKLAALSALRAGDKKRAVTQVDAMWRLDPGGFEKSIVEVMEFMQKDAKGDLVYAVVDAVATSHPGKAMLNLVQSILAMQINKKDLAEAKILEALRLQPNWDKALVFQAQMAAFSGDSDKAKAILKNAIAKYPADIKLKQMLAQMLLKSKDYEGASQAYEELVQANPKDNDSQFALALIHLQSGREQQAEGILGTLSGVPEWRSKTSIYLAKLAEKRGDVEKALVWYNAVTDEGLVFDASVAAIALLAKDKQFAEAESRLKILQSKYPNQKTRVLLLQSELYSQQKQFPKAFGILSEALKGSPDDKDILYTHALMAERVGKLDVLEANLRKILQHNPNSVEALNALGYTLVDKTTRYEEAERYLKRALELAPNEAVILDSYGWLQYKRGKLPEALDYLRRAYDKQREAEIAAHLAEVLWLSGKQDEAKAVFKEAFEKTPDDDYLLDFKKRLLDKAN